MPSRDNSTNPWADAANQAVGSLFKYYMAQPTAADALKQQYMQAQMDRIGVQNEMDTRQMGLGDYALPNLSPEIRNDMYRSTKSGDAATRFDAYVRGPMQVDAGDTKFIVSGIDGSPIKEYGVGTAPRMELDKENNQVVPIPAVPATNRPAHTPMAEMMGQYAGVPAVSDEEFNNYPVQPVHISNAPLNVSMLGGVESEVLPPMPNDPVMQDYIDKTNQIANGVPQQGQPITPIPLGGPTKEEKTKQAGKNNIGSLIATLNGLYDQLQTGGGAISEDQKWLTQNLPNSAAASGIGQMIGRATGSDEQAIRDQINGVNSMIFTALKPTLGLTGTQLDSKAEADYIKRMMGGVDIDINATRNLLNTLNSAYGTVPIENTPVQPNTPTGPVQIQSDDDYMALPSGTEFIDPEGVRRRKP